MHRAASLSLSLSLSLQAATVAALIHFFSVALAVGPTITAVRGGAEPGLREDHCLLCLHFSDEYLKDIADVISGKSPSSDRAFAVDSSGLPCHFSFSPTLTHSHSLTHSLTHSPTHPPTHSLAPCRIWCDW